MKIRLAVRELVLMSAPIALLFMGVMWFQVRSLKPAPLVVTKTTMTSMSTKRATTEMFNVPGQPVMVGAITMPNTVPRYQRSLDRKVEVVLNCAGQRPSWWGQDDLGTGAFPTSTASQLAWNVNAALSFKTKGKEVTYCESDGTIGVMGGTPHYDAALDRYVARFYLASTCVPSPDGRVKFEAGFWPNFASPPAKTAVWLKM